MMCLAPCSCHCATLYALQLYTPDHSAIQTAWCYNVIFSLQKGTTLQKLVVKTAGWLLELHG